MPGVGWDEQTSVPAGFEIQKLMQLLKDHHNICLLTSQNNTTTTTPINMNRSNEPFLETGSAEAIVYAPPYPFFGGSGMMPEQYYVQIFQDKPRNGYVSGIHAFDIDLNTVECPV